MPAEQNSISFETGRNGAALHLARRALLLDPTHEKSVSREQRALAASAADSQQAEATALFERFAPHGRLRQADLSALCAPHRSTPSQPGWFSIARFVSRSQATGADLVDDAYWTATCGALGANPGNQLNCVESLATVRMMGACADEGLTEGHLRQLYCGEGAWAEGREADYRAVFGPPAKEHVSDICT